MNQGKTSGRCDKRQQAASVIEEVPGHGAEAVPSPAPRISVIIPIYDKRVDEKECLDSWTDQTLPRSEFEVVFVSAGNDPVADRRIKEALGPYDRWICWPAASMTQLYDLGARRARSPLVLFTELHCLAERTCLQEVLTYFRTHDVDGACIRSEGRWVNAFGETESQIFDKTFAEWSRPGDWRKVLVRGFAIHKHTYVQSGGYDTQYAYFLDWELAARLNRQGYRLAYANKPGLLHYYNTCLGDFYPAVRSRVIDECRFRLLNSDDYCKEYFGIPEEWRQRNAFRPALQRIARKALLSSLWSALARRDGPRAMLSLIQEWARYLPLANRLLRAQAGMAMAWALGHCWWVRNHTKKLVSIYQQTYLRIEAFHRLRFMAEQASGAQPDLPSQLDYFMADVPEEHLCGYYDRETWHGDSFRWTRPVGIWSVNPPPGDYLVKIDTQSVRGNPLDYLWGVFFNHCRIRKSSLCVQDGCVHVPVDREMFVPGKEQLLALTAAPFWPDRAEAPDPRILGMPVFSVCFEPRHSDSHVRLDRARTPVSSRL